MAPPRAQPSAEGLNAWKKNKMGSCVYCVAVKYVTHTVRRSNMASVWTNLREEEDVTDTETEAWWT